MNKMGVDDNYIKVQPVLTPDRKDKRQNGRRFKEDGEPSFTLSTQDQHGVMITQHRRQSNEIREYTKNTPTVSSTYGAGGGNIPLVNNIRRLTEIECERLQGFPDDWTKYGIFDGLKKEISRTQRYKLCGNAVTTDVVKAIAERLILNQ